MNKILIEICKTYKNFNILNYFKLKLVFYYLNLFIFYIYPLRRHNISQKVDFILVKISFFKIKKQVIFLELIKNLINGFYIISVKVFSIN